MLGPEGMDVARGGQFLDFPCNATVTSSVVPPHMCARVTARAKAGPDREQLASRAESQKAWLHGLCELLPALGWERAGAQGPGGCCAASSVGTPRPWEAVGAGSLCPEEGIPHRSPWASPGELTPGLCPLPVAQCSGADKSRLRWSPIAQDGRPRATQAGVRRGTGPGLGRPNCPRPSAKHLRMLILGRPWPAAFSAGPFSHPSPAQEQDSGGTSGPHRAGQGGGGVLEGAPCV